ncbi:regulator of microtubule dynamics protein 2 [Caerostris darwini]|uniref:Regulator of microtubule dynamics protein 1 n=1 Tax=Caerostris darwini TaxID=1538125 RepID=A0AAV4UBU5_9ARAC|nr:regulator of microtubule dynamics protein 2 [Caerostris darwini]
MISQLNSLRTPMTLICLIPFNSAYPVLFPTDNYILQQVDEIRPFYPKLKLLANLTGQMRTCKENSEIYLATKQKASAALAECQIVVIKINIFLDQITTVADIVDQHSCSASFLDDPDEEYFDFTDTEDVTEVWASINGSQEDLHVDSNLDALLDELDLLLDSDTSDREYVYNRLCSMKEKFIGNADFLWRFAKAIHLFGIVLQNRNEMEKRKELAFEAYEYARKAYEIEKNNPEVHKWCAITVGCLGDFVGTQEKIMNGHAFKEHVDKAIALKPEDPSLHYMLGRWCYEVAMLSWLERKLAATLFSSPPEATLIEARGHLVEAEKLKPEWKENLLYLAKTYIGEGDYSAAIKIIDRALSIPVISEDDNIIHGELESLEYKYQTYRTDD